jgi:FtsZ-binding cell division protein ZapB
MSSSPMDKLDKQIQKVIARVHKLETENQKLEQKAAKLQESLEATPIDSGGDDWREEKEAIRQRVETLVEHLESVLGGDDEE